MPTGGTPVSRDKPQERSIRIPPIKTCSPIGQECDTGVPPVPNWTINSQKTAGTAVSHFNVTTFPPPHFRVSSTQLHLPCFETCGGLPACTFGKIARQHRSRFNGHTQRAAHSGCAGTRFAKSTGCPFPLRRQFSHGLRSRRPRSARPHRRVDGTNSRAAHPSSLARLFQRQDPGTNARRTGGVGN